MIAAKTLKLNGKDVPIGDERNLLELARKAGIDIPTFCYHSELSIYGACRLCLVEIEGRGIVASCSVLPEPGMVVRTHTEEIREMRKEAAAKGVATVIWSYPRGEAISKDGETAIDIAAYAAQIAALLGAHVIKIKLSTDHLELPAAKSVYEEQQIDIATQAARVKHCMDSAFAGRRIMVFSGGAKKGADGVFDDARAIRDGGGNGSIIGRNSFQRSREDALAMLAKLVEIYKGKA